jgi:RNA polymerase sigma factor (TIGR02999 family)
MASIGELMVSFRNGEPGAADSLFEKLYPELRRLAAAKMRRESQGHTWQPTVLVNELYLELRKCRALGGEAGQNEEERATFLGLAGFLMQRLLILHSRPLRQRSDHTDPEALELLPSSQPGVDTLQFVDGLLTRLEEIDPKLRQVTELWVFEGLNQEQIAARLGCSARTVRTHWAFARDWLKSQL